MIKAFLTVTALSLALCSATVTRADIFEWEYIDPADPGQGKHQSSLLVPDGADVDAVPGANLSSQNLTMAYLIGKNLTDTHFNSAILTNADLTGAELRGADFSWSTLTNVDLTGAEVRGAGFTSTTSRGFTASQFYSSASYVAKDLTGIRMRNNNLRGWNFAGQIFPDADFYSADLTDAEFKQANLSNASYRFASLTNADLRLANLTNASFEFATLTNADFRQANLIGARFEFTTLTNADLTGADVRDASFVGVTSKGFRPSQLYSTSSYETQDLTGIRLELNDLRGWDFAGQNLTNAHIIRSAVAGANLTGADLRGIFSDFAGRNLGGAVVTNLIRAHGTINGLNLAGDQTLLVRDYDGNPEANMPIDPIPVTVQHQFNMENGGNLQLRFEADAWDSTISFQSGISVSLGGTLSLDFAAEVALASQVGRTLDLFDWAGVAPTGEFTVESPYLWDLSDLYSTGKVTLIAVPEPSSSLLLLIAFSLLIRLLHLASIPTQPVGNTAQRVGLFVKVEFL